MTADDFQRIEIELGISLPAFYRYFMSGILDPRVSAVAKHGDLVLTETELLSLNFPFLGRRTPFKVGADPDWPERFLVIGSDNTNPMESKFWAIDTEATTSAIWHCSYRANGERRLDIAFPSFEAFLHSRCGVWVEEVQNRRDDWDGFIAENQIELQRFIVEKYPSEKEVELSLKHILEFMRWKDSQSH
jgi:hypothetical protein